MITHCINCQTELIPNVDNDPNGDANVVCARCRAEEGHDFDEEPDVEFDRCGNYIEKPFDIQVQPTSRGFNRADFVDKYGTKCSLQESSTADEPCIWLGCNGPNPQQMTDFGWREYKLPQDVTCTTRMHLTIPQVKALLPHLHKFVETGEIE